MCINNGLNCIDNKNFIIKLFSSRRHCDLCNKCTHNSFIHCPFCNSCIYNKKYPKHFLWCGSGLNDFNTIRNDKLRHTI